MSDTNTHNAAAGMDRSEIERRWSFERTILPASTADYSRPRTPYFYRKQALDWLRLARTSYSAGMRKVCLDLAKSYLRNYRVRSAVARLAL